MKREVKDLRDKTVMDFQEADVKTIEVTTPESTIELARESEGWKIEKPQPLKADTSEVNAFLSSLRGARAEDFIDEPGVVRRVWPRQSARESRRPRRQGNGAQGALDRRREGEGLEERPLRQARPMRIPSTRSAPGRGRAYTRVSLPSGTRPFCRSSSRAWLRWRCRVAGDEAYRLVKESAARRRHARCDAGGGDLEGRRRQDLEERTDR